MRTKSFIRQLVFVLILWLATGGGLTVRSQVIPNNTYIVNNRLPQPYLQPNNNTNPNNTNLNNTRAVFDQLNPSTTAPFTRPTQQPQPTTTQQNHTTTNPPQNDPHQNEPPKSGGIVLVNRTCDVFDRLFDSLNDRVTQPLRNLVGRSRLGSGIGRRRYISERDSFVGRQLRGMEIFGGQIEPPTTSNSSS
ncbi:MAG: hypothetical protein LBQ66_13555, partial [Planctomycetaceae bacterium]|nr:hypothetical protein [Planctomycetaceae bacterium]